MTGSTLVETALTVPHDHPAFAGHFPGQPLLPGVVLLGWACNALGAAIGRPVPQCTAVAAKFLQPVGPRETLSTVHLRKSADD